MIYYILIFGLGLACFSSLSFDTGQETKSWNVIGIADLLWFILCGLIFIIIGFRGENIGVDTINYIRKFLSISNSASYYSYGGVRSAEPLFYYLNKGLSIVTGGNTQSIIIAEAVFVAFGYFKTFRKYSWNPFITLLGFVSLGLFLQSLCLLRQTLAMSVCAYSLKYVFDKNWKKFYITVLIAMCFHYTAVFFAVVYPVAALMKFSKRNSFLLIGFSLIGYAFTDVLQNFASGWFDRWEHYSAIETGAQGYISFVIFLLITILAIVYHKEIIEICSFGESLLNLNYINMGLWLMRMVTRNAERIAFYFIIAPILLVPLIIKAIESKHGKWTAQLAQFLIVALMIAFFVYKVPRDASYYPYVFCDLWR